MNVYSGSAFERTLIESVPSEGFAGTTILVVGDLILDRYIIGDVTRISPEAPVPVLSIQREHTVAGGAANVALNVVGLNAKAYMAGIIGDDQNGRRVAEILNDAGVKTDALKVDERRPTTCKTRIMSGNQQIVRMDEEVTDDLRSDIAGELGSQLLTLLDSGEIDAVILSDYAKGVLCEPLTKSLIAACKARSIPVLVDPKRSDYSTYAGATWITPNQKEFTAALSVASIREHQLTVAGPRLRAILGCEALLVTQGVHGMTLVTADHCHHFPSLAEEVFDVCGAGDTVIASLATALAHGLDFVTAVQMSNAAASIVVRRAGTAPIDWPALYNLICGTVSHGERSSRNISASR